MPKDTRCLSMPMSITSHETRHLSNCCNSKEALKHWEALRAQNLEVALRCSTLDDIWSRKFDIMLTTCNQMNREQKISAERVQRLEEAIKHLPISPMSPRCVSRCHSKDTEDRVGLDIQALQQMQLAHHQHLLRNEILIFQLKAQLECQKRGGNKKKITGGALAVLQSGVPLGKNSSHGQHPPSIQDGVIQQTSPATTKMIPLTMLDNDCQILNRDSNAKRISGVEGELANLRAELAQERAARREDRAAMQRQQEEFAKSLRSQLQEALDKQLSEAFEKQLKDSMKNSDLSQYPLDRARGWSRNCMRYQYIQVSVSAIQCRS